MLRLRNKRFVLATLLPFITLGFIWNSEIKWENFTGYKCRFVPPGVETVEFNNNYWQIAKANNKEENYLFGAYYDDRLSVTQGKAFVRVIGIKQQKKVENKGAQLWCKLWYLNNSIHTIVKASSMQMWPNQFGIGKFSTIQMIPYLYSCDLSEIHNKAYLGTIPSSVSLVDNPCSAATNRFNITTPKIRMTKERKGIVVCVKGLDFPHGDVSYRIIEWVELLKLLGVSKIHFYIYSVLLNTNMTLEYYRREGIVDITPISLPGSLPNQPLKRHVYLRKWVSRKRQLELIPYNDCLYRYMHTHKFIVPMDIDEIIVPTRKYTWEEMLDAANLSAISLKPETEISSFNVKQNGCFFHGVGRTYVPEIPEYMHMLQHIYKFQPQFIDMKLSSSGTKGFMNTGKVVIALNHYPAACIDGICKTFNIPTEIGQLQHYKHYHRHCGLQPGTAAWKCKKLSCLNYLKDETIWKYKDKLIPMVNATVSQLKIRYQEVDYIMEDDNSNLPTNNNTNK